MKKLTKMIAVVMVMSLVLLACSQNAGNDSNKDGNGKRVAFVTAGTLGDNGFTDSANSGILKIGKDHGAKTTTIENNFDVAKYPQSMEAAFQWKPDVLFFDSYGYQDLVKQYADRYPDKTIVNLDFELKNDKNTISSVKFVEEEGAFMAGVVAAKVTTSNLEYANKEKIVGVMAGDKIPVIEGFIYGFTQGVKHVDPSIEIKVNYAGTFSDPVKGKQAAKQLYAQGADIVFQVAGLTGNGALEAAKEEKKYVIGVDSNQNGLYPGHVVTSMVKDLGGAIYDIYSKIENGTYKPGTLYEYGLGPNGVYLAIDENTEKIIPAPMLKEIKDIEQKVINGEIKVARFKQ